MYAERHPYYNRFAIVLQWIVLSLFVAQGAWMLAAETGRLRLVFPYPFHLFFLLASIILWIKLRTLNVRLEVSAKGWRIEGPFYRREIPWEQIRLAYMVERFPGDMACEHVIELKSGRTGMLICLEFFEGEAIFLPVEKPADLFDFLSHGVFTPEIRRKIVF